MLQQRLQSRLPQLWKSREHPLLSRRHRRVGGVVLLSRHPEQFRSRTTQASRWPCQIGLCDQKKSSSLAANLRNRKRQRLQGRRSFVSNSPSRYERLGRRGRRVVRAGRVDQAAQVVQVDRVDRASLEHRQLIRTVAEHRDETVAERAQLMAAARIVRLGRPREPVLLNAIGENRTCGSVSKDCPEVAATSVQFAAIARSEHLVLLALALSRPLTSVATSRCWSQLRLRR